MRWDWRGPGCPCHQRQIILNRELSARPLAVENKTILVLARIGPTCSHWIWWICQIPVKRLSAASIRQMRSKFGALSSSTKAPGLLCLRYDWFWIVALPRTHGPSAPYWYTPIAQGMHTQIQTQKTLPCSQELRHSLEPPWLHTIKTTSMEDHKRTSMSPPEHLPGHESHRVQQPSVQRSTSQREVYLERQLHVAVRRCVMHDESACIHVRVSRYFFWRMNAYHACIQSYAYICAAYMMRECIPRMYAYICVYEYVNFVCPVQTLLMYKCLC